ncbi:hypothetical protein QTH91_14520 [Variovorax dokdonensis]|uniref:CYTH domain-containing protein n=1 Tax=Variovorax dokdonensis TaxID=344883 RepID=A0ABT7NCM0_9BURK|nr:hypothetical protein [Variovorax dokdonensis]MDM0045701.1 hypothetical protein [Variovorax dokdonensis]
MSESESVEDWRPWALSLIVSGGRQSTLELELRAVHGFRASEAEISFVTPQRDELEWPAAKPIYVRAKVPLDKANDFLKRMLALRLGPRLGPPGVMDGTTYELGLTSGRDGWKVSWCRQAASVELAEVQAIAHELIELAESKGCRFERQML